MAQTPRSKQTMPQIASVTTLAMLRTARALPLTVDEAERKEGFKLYDQMYANPYIWAATMYLRSRIFENGLTLSPALEPPVPGANGKPTDAKAQAEFNKSLEVAAFCAYALEMLDYRRNSFLHTLRRMHSWVKYGQSVSELTIARIKEGEFQGMQGFDCVRYLPRRNYRMVCTPHGEILGAIGIVPEQGASALFSGPIDDPSVLPNFVPVERLLHAVINPSEDGPFGESTYRAAYRPWKAFNMVEPVELQNMFNFSGESMLFVGPEDGHSERPLLFPDGTTRNSTMNNLIAETMAGFQPNSASVVPFGTTKLDVGGATTDAFAENAKRKGGEMIMSILYSARTLLESNRNSQADAGQAQDVADAAVASAQEVLCPMVRHQLLRPLVILNFGREIADRMTPKVSLRKVAQGDTSKVLTAVSNAVSSGAVTKPMLYKLWPLWFGVEFIDGESLRRADVGPARSVPRDELDDSEEQDSRSARD